MSLIYNRVVVLCGVKGVIQLVCNRGTFCLKQCQCDNAKVNSQLQRCTDASEMTAASHTSDNKASLSRCHGCDLVDILHVLSPPRNKCPSSFLKLENDTAG